MCQLLLLSVLVLSSSSQTADEILQSFATLTPPTNLQRAPSPFTGASGSSAPDTMDWREKGSVTKVKMQVKDQIISNVIMQSKGLFHSFNRTKLIINLCLLSTREHLVSVIVVMIYFPSTYFLFVLLISLHMKSPQPQVLHISSPQPHLQSVRVMKPLSHLLQKVPIQHLLLNLSIISVVAEELFFLLSKM